MYCKIKVYHIFLFSGVFFLNFLNWYPPDVHEDVVFRCVLVQVKLDDSCIAEYYQPDTGSGRRYLTSKVELIHVLNSESESHTKLLSYTSFSVFSEHFR